MQCGQHGRVDVLGRRRDLGEDGGDRTEDAGGDPHQAHRCPAAAWCLRSRLDARPSSSLVLPVSASRGRSPRVDWTMAAGRPGFPGTGVPISHSGQRNGRRKGPQQPHFMVDGDIGRSPGPARRATTEPRRGGHDYCDCVGGLHRAGGLVSWARAGAALRRGKACTGRHRSRHGIPRCCRGDPGAPASQSRRLAARHDWVHRSLPARRAVRRLVVDDGLPSTYGRSDVGVFVGLLGVLRRVGDGADALSRRAVAVAALDSTSERDARPDRRRGGGEDVRAGRVRCRRSGWRTR